MHRQTIVVSLMALFLLPSVSAFGASGDKAKVKGMINTRTGETLIVKSADGNTTVVLTDDTTTRDKKGLFGLDKQQMSNAVLIPGSKVSVDGMSDEQGAALAKTITTNGSDVNRSEMIAPGCRPSEI